jgi:hypothetical protein
MTYIPLKYRPGVCKTNSPYTDYMEGGRITNMQGCRFNAGYPEKLGREYNPGFSVLYNIARGIKDIRTSTAIFLVTGETVELTRQTITSTGISATLATPLRTIGTSNLVNPFNTVSGTNLVTVTHTAHQQQTGDYVTFGTATAGGIVIGGVYTNIQVTGTNAYTFLAVDNASATTTAVGGTVAYNYYRSTLTNPFAVTTGVGTATVTHTAHGALAGDSVVIAGASAVGGITPSGRYSIESVPNANTYTIVHGTNASATATGGGTPNFLYSINNDSGRIWSLPRYGTQLLASPVGGTIYVWDSQVNDLSRAYPLNGAPSGVRATFVTPERFLFALGNSTNLMQVRWPDQEDYTDWEATPNNTANTRTLQEGSRLVGGIGVRDGVSLVLSDTACYAFNYSGDSFVYNSTLVGRGCGLAGPLAIGELGGAAFWISASDLWMWNGSLQKIPADDISDYVFSDLDTDNLDKCVVSTIAEKNEVWFWYPSLEEGIGENTRYVIYHADQQCFSTGVAGGTVYAAVTSMLDNFNPTFEGSSEPYKSPYVTITDGGASHCVRLFDYDKTNYSNELIYQQRVDYSSLDISNGNNLVDVFGFIPDFKVFSTNTDNTSSASLRVTVQDYPLSTSGTQGIASRYDFASPPTRIDTRLSGRLINHSWRMNNFNDFRIGIARIDIQPGGNRR